MNMNTCTKFFPDFLSPTFTWPHRILGDKPIPSSLPPIPKPSPYLIRRFWGYIHKFLSKISPYYCKWAGIPQDYFIIQLPFGLVLKWSDGTRIEEVLTMQTLRAAGFPVPKVINYGEHIDTPYAPISILMTRLPGRELGEVYEDLDKDSQATVFQELDTMLKTMRSWPNVWDKDRIFSITGTAIRSVRVPDHNVGPCENEHDFIEYLISPASSHSFKTQEEFEVALAKAKKLHAVQHRIVFTHGDLKHHNILVHEGHISSFLDWESTGWYPDYWEFTTALKYQQPDFRWYGFVQKLGGSEYMEEREYDRALHNLTIDSHVW